MLTEDQKNEIMEILDIAKAKGAAVNININIGGAAAVSSKAKYSGSGGSGGEKAPWWTMDGDKGKVVFARCGNRLPAEFLERLGMRPSQKNPSTYWAGWNRAIENALVDKCNGTTTKPATPEPSQDIPF